MGKPALQTPAFVLGKVLRIRTKLNREKDPQKQLELKNSLDQLAMLKTRFLLSK